MWYALAIPIVFSILAYYIWHKAFVWWELLVPTGVSAVAILISYYTIKNIDMHDVEYNGYTIVEARYYEYWETYVHKTCTKQVCTGSGKDEHCHTETYDCSYCDHNSPYWIAVDDHGNTYSITETKYKELRIKWKSQPKFVELNRSINHYFGCGQDGDMYSIQWDGKIETSESAVVERSFDNIVKASHSAFKFPEITDEEADSMRLYHYPQFYDFYKQNAILGLEQFPNIKYPRYLQTKFEYLNGHLGPINKVKVFTLLFKNKPLSIASNQEAYWDGGNQNELVVCISLDDSLNIQWVKPFSWCDNKRILVDTREDIAIMKKFNGNKIYDIYCDHIKQFFHYKPFSDFNYLTFEPTRGQLWFVYILTMFVSGLCIWWTLKNEFEEH